MIFYAILMALRTATSDYLSLWKKKCCNKIRSWSQLKCWQKSGRFCRREINQKQSHGIAMRPECMTDSVYDLIWYQNPFFPIHFHIAAACGQHAIYKTSKLLRTPIDSEKLNSPQIYRFAFKSYFMVIFFCFQFFWRSYQSQCLRLFLKHTNINHIDLTVNFHSLPFEVRTIDRQLIKSLMNCLSSHVAYFCRWAIQS